MTNPNQLSTTPEKAVDHEQQLHDLIASMTEITRRHTLLASNEIILLPEDEYAKLVKDTTRYVEFEFAQQPGLLDLPVKVTGMGLLMVAGEDDVVQGTERVFDGDEITGKLLSVSAVPVPSMDWLHRTDGTEDAFDDEVLAPAIVLTDVTYKADPLPDGHFESVSDLSGFHIFLPLVHHLQVAPARS